MLGVVQTVAGLAALGASVVAWTVRPPFRVQNVFTQFDFLGVGSIVLVALTGIFSGMVFAMQSWSAFELFGAESLVGADGRLTAHPRAGPGVHRADGDRCGPGSAIATELGTMR